MYKCMSEKVKRKTAKVQVRRKNIAPKAAAKKQSSWKLIRKAVDRIPAAHNRSAASPKRMRRTKEGKLGPYEWTPLPVQDFLQGLTAIGDAIPDKKRSEIPTDLSKNVDHYLYGTLK